MEQNDTVIDILNTGTATAGQTDAGNANQITARDDDQSNAPNPTDTNIQQAISDSPPIIKGAPTGDASTTSSHEDKSVMPSKEDVEAPANMATICIAFKDFGFEAIEGLKYKLKVDGKFTKGTTDATGNTATLTDLMPGSDVEVLVFREHTKDFKNIGTVHAYPGCTGYSIVSPKLKFETTTEAHFGTPGDAENDLPSIPPKSDAEKQEVASSIVAGATSSTAAKSNTEEPLPASHSVHSPHKLTTPLPTSKTAPKSQSSQLKKEQIAPGRNAEGHPQATVKDASVDWLKRKILAVFNFWSWQNFQTQARLPSHSASPDEATTKSAAQKNRGTQAAKSASSLSQDQAAQGHPKVNPLSSPATAAPGEKLCATDLARLQALVDFAEKQAEFDYLPYKGKGGATVNVLYEYAKKDAPAFDKKLPNKPLGLCQVYVKVALFKAGYTNGPGWEGQAKTSGKDWLKYGFTDVSNALPKIEITYENVLSPLDWPQAESHVKKKAELKKLQEEKKKQKSKMTEEEMAAAEKNIPSMPEKKKEVKYIQPDLMYTLPGDVIVYEQVDPVELAPAGHVDIRTYHGFVSDFSWQLIPSLGGRTKTGKRFRVTGVYRKISDTMAMARVSAFLRILREHEAKGFKEPYRALRFDPSANPPHIIFDDFSTHPYVKEKKNKPAGAYQIKLDTWEEITKGMIGWPIDFSPVMQDRIAIFLLQRRPYSTTPHPRRSALGYIMEGRVEDAINNASLWNEWSCLPGGGRESQMSMDRLKLLFNQYEQEYSK